MASERYTVDETNNWWWVETDDETLCRVDSERTARKIAAALNRTTDVADLAAALKPFADVAAWFQERDDGDFLISSNFHPTALRVGDCRHAATVLSKLEGGGT